MKINEKIYTLRKEHNLSQEELANELNVSRQTVSKWELGESCPDFDKIVPLCELFGISTEELLRDKKIENNYVEEPKKDIVKAFMICFSIFLYFAAIVWIIIGEELLSLNDGLTVSIFLLICGLATSLIIFACMTRSEKKEKKEIKNPNLRAILYIFSLITLCIYLIVSFKTMAWHITWIIWIIYSVIAEIIKLIFSLKGNNNEK